MHCRYHLTICGIRNLIFILHAWLYGWSFNPGGDIAQEDEDLVTSPKTLHQAAYKIMVKETVFHIQHLFRQKSIYCNNNRQWKKYIWIQSSSLMNSTAMRMKRNPILPWTPPIGEWPWISHCCTEASPVSAVNAIRIARALEAPEALPEIFFAHPEILPQFILRCQHTSPVIANTATRCKIAQKLNFRPRTDSPPGDRLLGCNHTVHFGRLFCLAVSTYYPATLRGRGGMIVFGRWVSVQHASIIGKAQFSGHSTRGLNA